MIYKYQCKNLHIVPTTNAFADVNFLNFLQIESNILYRQFYLDLIKNKISVPVPYQSFVLFRERMASLLTHCSGDSVHLCAICSRYRKANNKKARSALLVVTKAQNKLSVALGTRAMSHGPTDEAGICHASNLLTNGK